MKQKEHYSAPEVEIALFESESGFAGSDIDATSNDSIDSVSAGYNYDIE